MINFSKNQMGFDIKVCKNYQFLIALLFSILSFKIVLSFTIDKVYNNIPFKITSTIECTSSNNLTTLQPVADGLWNQPRIWPNGKLPTINDDVVIPVGRKITLAGTCRARTIKVNGVVNAINWKNNDAWINLETQSIIISGKFEIGTISRPYAAKEKCVITLKGDKFNNAPASHKGIMVMGGGSLELHGKNRKSWTNLAVTANVGATQITLINAVDWEVGDKIALTATGLASGRSKAWNNVDEAVITAISRDKRTLTLKTPLKHKHIGGSKSYTRARDGKTWKVNIQGEVGLLSHYIKIQGKMNGANETNGYGGHIMLMKNSIAHVAHVELYKMGQKGILGRYPFHWHLNEDKAKGSYLRNSSVHRSFNRAVTIHGTDYVTVDGIFAYDHIGHGIFFEDGGERFNSIKNNVIFVTRRPKKGEEVTPSDNQFNTLQNRTPASYWITNPNNYFENNVAAGTEGTGFWFAFPEKGPMFDSRNLSYYNRMVVWKEPLGKFDGFVAHTCMNGWDVFDQLNDNHSIKTNFGWDIRTDQYIQNGLFYGNDQAIYSGLGVKGDPTKVVYRNCIFTDNKTITMLASDITIENSLFNVDTSLGVFKGTREFYKFYDGPGRHIDCHFEGWNLENAKMMQQKEGVGATENLNPIFKGTTKGFSEPFPFTFVKLAPNARPRKVALGFKDYDGGFLGKAHTTLVRDVSFYRDGHEYRHPSWKNMARSDYYLGNLWLQGMGNDPAISIVRTKPGTDNACLYESGSTKGTYKAGLFVNEGFTYNYYLSKIPSSKKIQLIWYRGDPGDLTLVNFKGFGKLSGFKVSGSNIKKLTSKAEIEASKDLAYFIASNGDVYVKLRAKGGNGRTNVFFRWNGIGNYNALALPCTKNDFSAVKNTTPPTVSFQSPTNNQFDQGDDLGVIVNASDSDGTIVNVKLYINDILVRQEGVAPYKWGTENLDQNDVILSNLVAGNYNLKAVATDNEGNTSEAFFILTVQNNQSIKTNHAPIHDVYLQGSTRFNTANVRVETGKRTSYLMFDLSTINGDVSSAELKLTVDSDSGNGNINVYLGNSTNWTEFNLSNSNKPSKENLLASKNTTYTVNGTYIWNLNSITVGDKLSLIVEQFSGDDVSFWSKEGTIKPELVITTSNNKLARKLFPQEMRKAKISIYPNPVRDVVYLKDLSFLAYQVKIYSFDGQEVASRSLHEKQVTAKLDMNNLLPGIYFVKVYAKDDAIIITKLLKE
ncbi:G8 domain-containing protein [Aquimarina sp. W85]|uniref:G8 domain-containing protein n=1 Tax=Aquimarina rhodophyticola TaxID=3342246 RepID=UPI00366DAAAF